MARPTKYTKEKGKKIADLIKAGNFANRSAEACGISEPTFYRWMTRGREAEEKYKNYLEQEETWESMDEEDQLSNPNLEPNQEEGPTENERNFIEFRHQIKQAEAEAEAAAVIQIKSAASSGTWQAAAWFLERKFKDRWSKTDKIEGTVQHQLGINVSETELEAARARLEAARGIPETTEELIDVDVIEEDDDMPF
jgi:hypothetical protein